jgi:hypothetical protein
VQIFCSIIQSAEVRIIAYAFEGEIEKWSNILAIEYMIRLQQRGLVLKGLADEEFEIECCASNFNELDQREYCEM